VLHQSYITNCLSWDHNEYSKEFFKALLRFIDILGKKGCYKASLEYNKVLLKLNPTLDPVGAILCLDFSAISARNYDFLIHFVTNFA
jgi:hypothetical protein